MGHSAARLLRPTAYRGERVVVVVVFFSIDLLLFLLTVRCCMMRGLACCFRKAIRWPTIGFALLIARPWECIDWDALNVIPRLPARITLRSAF